MDRKTRSIMLIVIAVSMLSPLCLGKENGSPSLREQERYTLSLELEFSKKNSNALQKVANFLNLGPNGYATGFVVGDGLVMTAYHVVSGEISDYKKVALGFAPSDHLQVRVYVNGCQAKVIRTDKEADLALLEVCGSKRDRLAAFQSNLNKDEKLLLIARPHGDKILSRGTFYGSYSFNGLDYWSVKLSARDGFSGSPVYNEKAELVGVMSGYDWAKKLALVSPGARAQKLIDDYNSAKP